MSQHSIGDLLMIMRSLRDPNNGCPWDREQDFASIAPYTIEESYEVAEAIAEGDMAALKEELGDLLFQVVFHAQMASEKGHFGFADVVDAICFKMLRRHPHVFGDDSVEDAEAQTRAWEEHKRLEREEKARARGEAPSALDGVAHGYPALMRAVKLSKRAARVGFDWPEAAQVLDKIQEETEELAVEMAALRDGAGNREAVEAELGDILFAYTNLARFLDVDPERALRGTNRRFEQRFRRIEAILAAAGEKAEQKSLEELEALWQQAKQELRDDPPAADRQ
ncbi:MAG: nucleoside triphosphate pyrophosphohydrolase [Alphaproteobacteria bacterium]|nr:nucleoside triphosphate pyrophosphohydrolase [Alphaproteobacteria bacterium]